MANIRPNQLPAAASVNPSSAIIVDAGGPVEKATPLQVVDAGRPKASQVDAETGTDNEKIMTPLRVKQAIEELSDFSLRPDLGSSDPGEGSDLVGLVGRAPSSTALDLTNWIQAQPTNAREFGVVGDGSTDNLSALTEAINYARLNGNRLVLPPGEIVVSGDLVIDVIPQVGSGRRETFTMEGAGSGVDGSWLHFTSGSLKVHAVHQLSDFRVTSDDSDGIVIEPSPPPIGYPARSGMRNVHASYCAGSGIVISANWIYLMTDVYARYNGGWGIEGRGLGVPPYLNLSCNAWNIIGGEFQGNGTRQGDPSGPLGGTERGIGGGIYLGQAVQANLIGPSIEGNVGDGLKLGEQSRGVAVIGAYFEKNGSHHENRDICNDQPSSAVNGPNSVYILNSQFTPQNYNGTVQERAIDLWDCVALRIISPQFFTSEGSGYSEAPIYIRESVAGRCSGWVEDRYYTSILSYPELLTNDTARFGYPRVIQFSPDLLLPPAVQTDSQRFYVDMPYHYGRRIDIDYDVRPVTGTGNSAGQFARLQTRISRGPNGALFSSPSANLELVAGFPSMRERLTTSHVDLPGGSAEIVMRRLGDDVQDTAAGDVRLLGLRVTAYAGVISALEKA